ncbi:MAG: radical SAM protein [Myxococcota bacterium]|nr:radical SAM protein [Myxococcota bacterium]
MAEVVLIHPPVALPTEPPIGIATLAAGLRRRGVEVLCLDAAVECLHGVLEALRPADVGTIAQRKALGKLPLSLTRLRTPAGYEDRNLYWQAVAELGQLLSRAGELAPQRSRLGLASYQEEQRTPLSSRDLRAAAADPHGSVFDREFARLVSRVAEARPRVVGLSVNYLHQALPALRLAGHLRERLGDTPILLGGGLVRCWEGRLPPDGLRPAVDEVVGEAGIAALLRWLGLPADDEDDHHLPLPDYTGMPWELYLAPTRIAPLVTSRGCVWGRCRYCPEALAVSAFHPTPPAELAERLRLLARAHGAGLIHLGDSAIPPLALRTLAAAPGLPPWYGFARFHPDLTRPEFCHQLRQSGCRLLQLGLESGSDRVLTRLRKGIDLGQAAAALRALAAAGVPVYLYVMFGVPGETRDDALQTSRFVAEHADGLVGMNTSLLNLPVGSPPEEDVTTQPLPGADCDLTLYRSFSTAGGWDRRQARHFLEREFAREPAIARLLHLTPPVFGPNHTPFLPSGPPPERADSPGSTC